MTPFKKISAVAVLALSGAVLSAPADAQDRFRLVLNGIYNTSKPTFSDTRTFTEYAETATVTADYAVDAGFGGDVGLQVSFYKGLGVLVGYSATSRDVTGSFDASLPHPLFLNRPRSLEGEFSGFKYKEGAVYADLAYVGGKPGAHLEWTIFAGASFFQVEVDLLERAVYDQTYPYDSVTLREAQATTVKESPVGFNVGGRLDYRFGKSRRFGAGILARYSVATVTASASEDATAVEFDAGGFEVGAGIRVYF
jgi:hypothetical protein